MAKSTQKKKSTPALVPIPQKKRNPLKVIVGLVALGVVVGIGLLYFSSRFMNLAVNRDGKNPAELVIVNAKVFTSDEKNPWAEAVAVKYQKIAYVGGNEGIANFVGPNTKVIDAKGKMLTPGFVDNHCHVLWLGALRPFLVSLFEAPSFDEIRTSVAEFSAQNPNNPFLLGIGWRYAAVLGGKPDAKLLDSIVADRPVFMWSVDGGTGWVNTRGLKRMIERNPYKFRQLGPALNEKGEPTGLFYEFYAFNPFDYYNSEELPEKFDEKMYAGMKEILEEVLHVGVTSVNDAQLPESFVPTVLDFKARGGLEKVRARGLLYVGHHALKNEKQLRADLRQWKELGRQHSDSHLWLGDGIKLYADGVFGAHTAAVLEPYSHNPGGSGRLLWAPEEFIRVAAVADNLGLQVCTHAIGDRAIQMVVDGYEETTKLNESKEPRHRIEHCEIPTPQDQERMARLGIYAAMQPAPFYSDKDVEEALGEERLERLMPWASMQKAGVPFSFGSDWLAAPINPLYGLLLATTRLNYKGETDWGPEEALSMEEAIRHYTINSAQAMKREKEIGSIEVGKYADLVLFSIDLRNINSWWFLLWHPVAVGAWDDFVVLTIVDGKIVYCRPGTRL